MFALVGYQLFHGTMKHKCVQDPGEFYTAPDSFYAVHTTNDIMTSENNIFYNSTLNNIDYVYYYYDWNQKHVDTVSNGVNLYPIFNKEVMKFNESDITSNIFFSPNNMSRMYERTKHLKWDLQDAFLLGNLSKAVNETETKWSWDDSPSTNTCSEVEKCLTASSVNVAISSLSSILQTEADALKNSVVNIWNCQEFERNNVSGISSSFNQSEEELQNNTQYMCSVSIKFRSLNISCLQNIFENFTCSDNSIWINLYHHLNTFVTKPKARKSIVLFNIDDQSSEIFNFSSSVKSGFRNTYVLFQEYHRDHMLDEVADEWDNNPDNYAMQPINQLMYYYLKSANIPNSEPKYCIINDK